MPNNSARVTLEMLHKLEDFENWILETDNQLFNEAPESSRGLTTAQRRRIELKNIRGCIAGLKNSILVYRGSVKLTKLTG